MSFSFLLDTNIVSDLIRNPHGLVAEKIAEVGESNICTNVIVASELRYGAVKSGSVRLAERVDQILSAIEILPLEVSVDKEYGKLRHLLGSQGTPIGPNDMLIAAHALYLDLVVITANTREFSRVPGLKLENWLEI